MEDHHVNMLEVDVDYSKAKYRGKYYASDEVFESDRQRSGGGGCCTVM
jgi:hypothetical protein